MKCRCAMCGMDDAGRVGRRSYAAAGVQTAEAEAHGPERVRQRRQRRHVEKRFWIRETRLDMVAELV